MGGKEWGFDGGGRMSDIYFGEQHSKKKREREKKMYCINECCDVSCSCTFSE